MGMNIAQLFAQHGFHVIARDVTENALKIGLETIRSGPYGLEKAVKRGKLTENEAKTILGNISLETDMAEACKEADFVVEAVYEDLDLKKRIFKELDKLCREDVILATNTSTLSVTTLASVTQRTDKVIGMHFFNPAHVMKLVEIIKGLLTSNETIKTTKDLAIKLGRTPIIVNDSPGFSVGRLGLALFLEASRLVEEGVTSIMDIDIGMRLGYDHSMGPFELVDLVGLDSRLRNYEAMYEQTMDPRWSPPKIAEDASSRWFLG